MKRWTKKDSGTIFSPVMYLMILLLTAQLLILFVEYKRVAWVSGAVTDTMTDALLGACTLDQEELYHYGMTDELTILHPEEKYRIFKKILQEELGLSADMQVTEKSPALLADKVIIKDFRIYSVEQENIIFYDVGESGSYTRTVLEDARGVYSIENGKVIAETTLAAQIGFTVKFFGVPIEVNKYHMVDVTNGG